MVVVLCTSGIFNKLIHKTDYDTHKHGVNDVNDVNIVRLNSVETSWEHCRNIIAENACSEVNRFNTEHINLIEC